MAGRARCWAAKTPAARQRQQQAQHAFPEGEIQDHATTAILRRSQASEAIDSGGAILGPVCVNKRDC